MVVVSPELDDSSFSVSIDANLENASVNEGDPGNDPDPDSSIGTSLDVSDIDGPTH